MATDKPDQERSALIEAMVRHPEFRDLDSQELERIVEEHEKNRRAE